MHLRKKRGFAVSFNWIKLKICEKKMFLIKKNKERKKKNEHFLNFKR
jgi:hypothetical protein